MCKVLKNSVFIFALCFLSVQVLGRPMGEEDDTAIVESTIRETREAVPARIEDILEPGVKEAYLHSYGDDENAEGDVQGYHKRTQDKGKDGYKHDDSYHVKDGDKYGFEKHTEYGKEGKKTKVRKYPKDGASSGTNAYKVYENAEKDKKKAVEDYGDSGFYSGSYADGGDSEGYTGDGEYNEGSGESEHYESEGDGESAGYFEGDGEAESEGYSEGDYDY